MSQALSGGARKSSPLLAVAVVVLLALAVYNVVELSTAQSQMASLQQENSALQQEIFNLHAQVGSLQAQPSYLTRGNTQTASFQLQSACLRVNAGCSGNSYVVILDNNGSMAVPVGYSIFISFKDGTRGTHFGFNTSLRATSLQARESHCFRLRGPPGPMRRRSCPRGTRWGLVWTWGASRQPSGPEW